MTSPEHEEKFEIFGIELKPDTVMILSTCLALTILTIIRLLYEGTKMKLYVPESALLVIIGLILGTIIVLATKGNESTLEKYLTLPPDVFLYIFVPVIIYDATYFLNKHAFFTNFGEIVTYAVVGTLISTFIIGGLYIASSKALISSFSSAQLLTFAALASAVDPVAVIAVMESMHVDETLFNLVFGESTLNDGVAIVLFNLFSKIQTLQNEGKNFGQISGLAFLKFLVAVFGAILLSIVVTSVFCLITRLSHKIPSVQPLILLLGAMCSYVLADMLLFSGIIAVMTSALIQARYAEYNLTLKSIDSFNTLVHMLAQTFEAALFADMGIQVAFIIKAEKEIDWGFTFLIIPFTILARAAGTFLLTALLNIRRRHAGATVTFKEQIIILLCGLRGGIAFALARNWDLGSDALNNQMLLATCIIIVFTILVYGLTMRPIIKALRIKVQRRSNATPTELIAAQTLLRPAMTVSHAINGILGKKGAAMKFLQKMDRIAQKIFLNTPLPNDRELNDNVEEIQRLNFERIKQMQQNQEDRRQSFDYLMQNADIAHFAGQQEFSYEPDDIVIANPTSQQYNQLRRRNLGRRSRDKEANDSLLGEEH